MLEVQRQHRLMQLLPSDADSVSDDECCDTPICHPHHKVDLEVNDPQHRYSKNLRRYQIAWEDAGRPGSDFWGWLMDTEDTVSLDDCPRSLLNRQVVMYLSPRARREYELDVRRGRCYHSCQDTPFTTGEGEWIFVVALDQRMYCHKKVRGQFHHTSFLSAGPCCAAGAIRISDGSIKALYPHSGHYRPGEQHLVYLLEYLAERGVALRDFECDAQRVFKVCRDADKSKKSSTVFVSAGWLLALLRWKSRVATLIAPRLRVHPLCNALEVRHDNGPAPRKHVSPGGSPTSSSPEGARYAPNYFQQGFHPQPEFCASSTLLPPSMMPMERGRSETIKLRVGL